MNECGTFHGKIICTKEIKMSESELVQNAPTSPTAMLCTGILTIFLVINKVGCSK